MAKYQWQGDVLSISLDDAEGAPIDVSIDMSKLDASVVAAAARFGMQTALRNATAGKMDDVEEARKAIKAKAQVFASGVWTESKEQRAKLELTQAEQDEVIAGVIVAAKQGKGDKRDAASIMKAFRELDGAKQAAAIASVQKLIDKSLKAKLKQKKEVAKAGDGLSNF